MAAKKGDKWPAEEPHEIEQPKAEPPKDLDDPKLDEEEAADRREVVEKAVPVTTGGDPKKEYAAERERQARDDRLRQHQQETKEATGAPVENPETAAAQHQAEREAERKAEKKD
jgi:hypothetical protein